MDKCLKPESFLVDLSAPDAKQKWRHWNKTLTSYIGSIKEITNENKLNVLINHIDSATYKLVSDCESYDEAVTTLRNIFVKPTDEIFARYLLSSCKQQPDQSIDEYLQELKRLFKDGYYTAVTVEQHKQQAMRDAFVAGVLSTTIRYRLLESMDLQQIVNQARSLEAAQQNSKKFRIFKPDIFSPVNNTTVAAAHDNLDPEMPDSLSAANSRTPKINALSSRTNQCYYCENKRHSRKDRPAKDSTCFKFKKIGHFSIVCHAACNQLYHQIKEQLRYMNLRLFWPFLTNWHLAKQILLSI